MPVAITVGLPVLRINRGNNRTAVFTSSQAPSTLGLVADAALAAD